MTRKKCTATQECELSPRAVGHLKDCPQRQTDAEKRLEAQPETAAKIDEFLTNKGGVTITRERLEVPLDSLRTAAEKERIGDASRGMTVVYDMSPLDTIPREDPVFALTPEEKAIRERLVAQMTQELLPPPSRPWWKFWGRRG